MDGIKRRDAYNNLGKKSRRYPVGVCKEVNLDQSFAGPQNFEHVLEFNPWGLDWVVILFASHATFSGSNVQREALRKIALMWIAYTRPG